MKKLICLLMALVMVVTCVGCSGKVENVGTENTVVEEVQTAETETMPAAEESAEPADAETVEEVEAEAAEENEEKTVSVGRYEDGVYVNDYIDIRITLGDSWTYTGAEELQDMTEIVKMLTEGTDIEDYAATAPHFTDMQAMNNLDGSTINVVLMPIESDLRLAYALMSEEQIVDATLEQQDALVETYANAGIEVKEMSKKYVTCMGEERPALYSCMTAYDVDCYTVQLLDYGLGQYGATITVASYMEDTTDSLLELIEKAG